MLRLVSELDRRGAAANLGYSNTAALLINALRIDRADATRRLSQAEALLDTTTPTGAVIPASLPVTAAALQRGDLGSDHVKVIQKTLKGLEHLNPAKLALAEAYLVAQALDDAPHILSRHAGRVREMVDPDGPPPDDRDRVMPERMLQRQIRSDGRMHYKGYLDPESSALFEAMLKPFEKPDPEIADDRGYAERAGDAFADVLRMAASAPDLPTKNGLRTEVAFTISLDALTTMADDTVLPGQSDYLTAREARRIACDAHALPAVMNGNSKPLDVAVPQYVVPAHIRRGLVLRDRGCSFPSCNRPASTTDAHHIKSHLKGGPTQLENLVLLCPGHHRLIHRSEWTVRLDNNGTAWFTPPPYIDPERTPRRNQLWKLTTAGAPPVVPLPYGLGAA